MRCRGLEIVEERKGDERNKQAELVAREKREDGTGEGDQLIGGC